MKKIIKRIICIVLAIAIAVVSFGSVTFAAETTLYKTMFNVNQDDVTKTAFNKEIIPNNFSVESKEVVGNEKHYLTWNNVGIDNPYDYKVEIYSIVYIKYKYSEQALTAEQLDNTEWQEMAFPVIHSVDVDASDCGTVINYSDVKAAYSNSDFIYYDKDVLRDKILMPLEKVINLVLSFMTRTQFDGFKDFNDVFYAIDNGVDGVSVANYFQVGRVKYYARYVSKHSKKQLLQPDADGYYHYYFNFVPIDYNDLYLEVKDDYGHVIGRYDRFLPSSLEKYEFISRERLYLYVDINRNSDYILMEYTRQPNGSYEITSYEMLLVANYRLKSQFNSEIESNEYNIGQYKYYGIYSGKTYLGSNEDEAKSLREIDISNMTNVDQFYLDTNIPVNFEDKNKSEISDWINDGVYSYNTVTVGKFIENDTQIINVKPTPSPTPDVSSSPDVTTAPPSSSPKPTPTPSRYPGTGDDYTDTNVHDDNSDMSDVVHWLKMIYNRLGKQLEQFQIINTVVEKLDEIISNQKKMIDSFSGSNDTGTDSDNNDVVKYLKKIYNVLIANMVTSAIKDVMDYVNSFVQDVGQGISDAADTVYETASNTFPLSVIFIPKLVFETLSHDPVTPNKKISFTKPVNKICGVNIPEYKFEFQLDLKDFNDLAKICRNCIVIVFLFGMVNYTADVVRMINDTVGSD